EVELETVPVLKAAARAHRRLAELKGRTNTVPNPTILLNTIALQEAKVSSEIENIYTTNDELFRGLSMDAPGMSPHAKEVLHYNDALWQGAQRLREKPAFSTEIAVHVVNTIKGDRAGIRSKPGTQLMNPTSGEVIYTPPSDAKHLRALLENLQWFANEPDDGLDPLVKMAVIHY